MRKISLVLALSLVIGCFAGCGKDAVPDDADVPEITAQAAALSIVSALGRDSAELIYINGEYNYSLLTGYIEGYYGLAAADWEDAALYRAQSAEDPFEITLFRLRADSQADAAAALEEYRKGREGTFFGYAPEAAAMINASPVCLWDYGGDRWCGLLICEDPAAAQTALESIFGADGVVQEPTPTPEPSPTVILPEIDAAGLPDYYIPYIDPEIDDMTLWDSSAFLAAWQSGSDEALDKENKKLFKKCQKLMDELIEPGMTELEKEWAVYSWLVANVEYDHRHYEIPNSAPRTAYEPYGAIIDKKAVCLGYAEAFRLLMELAGIECITVVGAAFECREDHAWNMVKLDGQWYCTDATWDYTSDMEHSLYFNVSSDVMAMQGHQWPYDEYPMAEESMFR